MLTATSITTAETSTVTEAATATSETTTVTTTRLEAIGTTTALHTSWSSTLRSCWSRLEEAGLSGLLGISIELVTCLE